MAKLLIECGAEIDALTNVNNTALQLGKMNFGNSRLEELNQLNNKELAKLLLEWGAKIDAQTNVKKYCLAVKQVRLWKFKL